jgi:hypothetical protein
MNPGERKALRRRFHFRSGYCGVRESDVGAELTVDHFHPRARGGADTEENWVYCCHACNEFKGEWWRPRSMRRILYPLRDRMANHVAEREDGTLVGTTSTGRFHIERLRLNRDSLVACRRERRLLDDARQRQTGLLRQARNLEREVRSLMAEMDRLRRGTQN